jgi:hypothetical protein
MTNVLRRRMGALQAVVAMAVAACSSGPPSVGARLAEPRAVVAFTGITSKQPGVVAPYLAIASSRNDEVQFIDPADNQPVLGPAVVFPLSVPTEARPLHLAAAALGDRAAGGADLLAVASNGSLDVQVVETWSPSSRVVPAASVDLAPFVTEGEILGLAAMTAPGAGPGSPRARLLVAVSGGRLVVVDFTRDAATGGVVPQTGTVAVKPLAAPGPGGDRWTRWPWRSTRGARGSSWRPAIPSA